MEPEPTRLLLLLFFARELIVFFLDLNRRLILQFFVYPFFVIEPYIAFDTLFHLAF